MMAVMLPLFFLAMYEKDGQPLEVVAKHFYEAKFKRPKTDVYKRQAFVPKSNRGKYCPGCAGCMKKRKAAERKRKQRQKCHALEPFKPA